MADTKLTTPVAIIVAGILIAVGAFFGLRGRPAPGGTAALSSAPADLAAGAEATTARENRPAPLPIRPLPAGTTAAVQAPVGAGGAVEPAPVSPKLPVADDPRAKVIEEVKRTFESLRPTLVERCWKPSIKAQPEPKTARLTFNFSFAADGQQLSRGVMEDRRSNRAGLGTCVGDAIPLFPVPAPGVPTYIEVPFELP